MTSKPKSPRPPQDANLGLRLVHLKKSFQATRRASETLGENGVIESGDILLSLRPAWADTLAYAHVQLGISHAALAFVVEMDGKKYVHSLESPMSYSSFLDSPHQYGDLEAFHILRPTLTEAEKSNLKQWAKLAMSHPDRFAFFSDYSKPMYKRGLPGVDRPIDQVRLLAKVIKDGGPTFSCYCSEFVWTFLGLRKCSPDEFPNGTLEMFFDPLKGFYQDDPKAGLTQGPDAALRKSGNPNRTQILTSKVFVDFLDSPSDLQGRMSSGHQAVARANKPKMELLKHYYASGEPSNMVQEIKSRYHRELFSNGVLDSLRCGFEWTQIRGNSSLRQMRRSLQIRAAGDQRKPLEEQKRLVMKRVLR